MLFKKYSPALNSGAKILPSQIAGLGFTTGNIYYVIKTSNTFYSQFVRDFGCTYTDGSYSISADAGTGDGIQAALNKCVAERDDYVIVLPDTDDYDLTAALTMSKRNVHLIAPAGLGMKYGATNAVRLHQNTALAQVITVTAQCCEIAGFFVKGADDTTLISGSTHTLSVHECMIGMGTTDGSTTAYGIYGGSGECVHWEIANNLVTNYNPVGTSKTLGGGIVIVNGTRCLVRDNLICTGAGTTTFTVGISVGGTPAFVMDNRLTESLAGVFTTGIIVSSGTAVFGNWLGMTTTTKISGAESGVGQIENYQSDATTGGKPITG